MPWSRLNALLSRAGPHHAGAHRFIYRMGAALIFAFVLISFEFPMARQISTFIVCFSLFQAVQILRHGYQNSTQSIFGYSIFNLIFSLLSFHLLTFTLPFPSAESAYWPPQELSEAWPLSAALGFLTIGLFALIYWGLFQFLRHVKTARFPLLVCSLVIVILGEGASQTSAPLVRIVCAGLVCALCRSIWIMSYQLSEIDFLRRRPFFEHLATLNAPWQIGWANYSVLRGYSDYLNHSSESDDRLFQTQINAVKLILYALLLKLISAKFGEFFFSKSLALGPWVSIGGFSSRIHMPFSPTEYLSGSFSVYQAWCFVLARAGKFLLDLASYTNAVVAIAWMFGFDIPRNVDKPYLATTFNQFLNRIYFYYIAILQRFFFYPLFRIFRFVRHRSLRLFLTTSMTIIVGGLTATVFRYAPLSMTDHFSGVYAWVWARIPYFAALGLLTGISSLQSRSTSPLIFKMIPKLVLPTPIKAFGFFVLYAICFSLQTGAPQTPMSNRAHAFLHLFGL